jgi:hypothetical protein
MPTPTERLSARKAKLECRVCAWLDTLSEKDRREWQAAIMNTRFGATMVADEVNVEIASQATFGGTVGETSVRTHRARGHR